MKGRDNRTSMYVCNYFHEHQDSTVHATNPEIAPANAELTSVCSSRTFIRSGSFVMLIQERHNTARSWAHQDAL